IWDLERFSNSIHWWRKDADVIPCEVRHEVHVRNEVHRFIDEEEVSTRAVDEEDVRPQVVLEKIIKAQKQKIVDMQHRLLSLEQIMNTQNSRPSDVDHSVDHIDKNRKGSENVPVGDLDHQSINGMMFLRIFLSMVLTTSPWKVCVELSILATTLKQARKIYIELGSTSGIRACRETLRVSTEDANQKFLKSLPSAWSQISLIMRTKPGVDSLSFDDMYNNLRVFEPDVKGSTTSSSSTSSGHNPQREGSSSYTDELMYSFFANQSSGLQLDHEDLEQLDEFDLEEIDLKWQVAMISMRLKKFYKKTGRKLQFDAKELVGFDKAKLECYNCHKTGHFAREYRSKGNQDSRRRNAGYTRNSGSDTEVTSCSKECKESYAKLKKLYDEQREQLGDASIEIQAYTQALKKVEAQLVAHQQNQLWYEEKIRFMKIDLDDKTDVLTYHKKLLTEAEKEKEELKAKVEKWHNSSKNLNIRPTSQMSARDKAGLRYGNQMNKGVLSYENEVFESVFYRIYIPSGPDVEIDESQFTYGPKQSKPSKSDARSSEFNSCESNSSKETLKSMPEPIVNEPKVDVPHKSLENKGIVDSGCSRHMTGNKAYLAEYQDYNGGPVAFGGSKCYITGKDKIKTGKLDFEDVCFVKELQHFNLFSVSQMCDKKNKVLFTDTKCLKEANHSAGTQDNINAENSKMEAESAQDYFVLPIWSSYTSTVKSLEAKNKGEKPNKTNEKPVDQEDQVFLEDLERLKSQEKEVNDAAEALRKKFARY
ncbi:hypothetical protein Tco_1072161, partial [Tanacetum coccineum]